MHYTPDQGDRMAMRRSLRPRLLDIWFVRIMHLKIASDNPPSEPN